MKDTIKTGIVKKQEKKAIEFGITNPQSDFDKRANQGEPEVKYVKGK